MQRLTGKVAIVTGVSSGIGLATAQKLCAEGASVVGTSRRQRTPSQFSGDAPARARWLAHDVTVEGDWKRVIDETLKAFGRLDILVNNAGILAGSGPTSFDDATLAGWDDILRTNVEGVFLGCRAAIPIMSNGGVIVNMSSVAARTPTPAFVAYGASKAAVSQLSRTVAAYCAAKRNGIRCVTLCPGIIETPLGDHVIAGLFGGDQGSAKATHIQGVPLGRIGRPEDIANAVVYLASEEASFITGTDLVIDGGRLT